MESALTVQLLCAADLHLGRRPSGSGLPSAGGWNNLVEHAVDTEPDLVVLAGDVIDQLNHSYEAWGILDRGLEMLEEAGIPVVAVAGNHDADTLADVVAEIGRGRMHLLGAGGEWERWTLRDGDGRERLHVDGWSFPGSHWGDDPTASYALARDASVPTVGLLHCDLDGPLGSSYAPVSAGALRRLPPHLWVLGHVHAPRLEEGGGGAPLLYPGSLQALDPGEVGERGAWRVEVSAAAAPAFEPVPLSPTRYSTVEVDVEGADDAAAVTARVRAALRDHLDEASRGGAEWLRAVHCRLRLTGRTALHDRLEQALRGIEDFDPTGAAGARLVVDPRATFDTRPALDLEGLARGSDAPAHLARLLLALDAPDPALVERVEAAVATAVRKSHYLDAGLHADPPAAAVDAALRRQAGRLLDALMASREVA